MFISLTSQRKNAGKKGDSILLAYVFLVRAMWESLIFL